MRESMGAAFEVPDEEEHEHPDHGEGPQCPGQDPPEVAPEVYVVVKGDSLFDISERWLGDGWLYPKLHQANIAEIGPDPDRIEPGMRLVKP